MKRILMTAMAAMITTTVSAGGNFQVGGTGPLLVKSIALGIKSPQSLACPPNAPMQAWIYTTKAGKISYMIIRHGQGAGQVKTVNAQKYGSKYVAQISGLVPMPVGVDAKYRIAAKGIGDYKFSNWVPLKAC